MGATMLKKAFALSAGLAAGAYLYTNDAGLLPTLFWAVSAVGVTNSWINAASEMIDDIRSGNPLVMLEEDMDSVPLPASKADNMAAPQP